MKETVVFEPLSPESEDDFEPITDPELNELFTSMLWS